MYRTSIKIIFSSVFSFFIALHTYSQKKEPVTIIQQQNASIRTEFGIERLKKALLAKGYPVTIELGKKSDSGKGKTILVEELALGKAPSPTNEISLEKIKVHRPIACEAEPLI